MTAAKSWIMHIIITLGAICSLGYAPDMPSFPQDNSGSTHLKIYNAPGFYVFHTDVSLKTLRQIWLRMNFAANAYQERLHDIFGGDVTQKQPFYIFKDSAEYYLDGGMPGSAGVFIVDGQGERLMAIGSNHLNHQRWHVMQHEAFHQFTFAFLRAFLPPWANEGLAEFFGEGLFTGSSFVTGWIPPYREQRIKKEMTMDLFMSIHNMRKMPYKKWNDALIGTNYDEAWSMIYFLAYANHGRYARPFTAYLRLFKQGMSSEAAWERIFGNNDADFEKLWEKYWLNMPPNATAELFARVQTEALTNFLARAYTLRQKFPSAQAFLTAAQDGSLKVYHFPKRLWLPPNLLRHASTYAPLIGKWSLTTIGLPRLTCTMPDGTRIIGSFRLSDNHPEHVRVKVISPHSDHAAANSLETVAH